MSHPIPLTVIGGFLGAGKTSLLNRILREGTGERLAVLVNDFGGLAIDESLVVAHGGDTIALSNGCICCSIGNDLVATLIRLLSQEEPPERIVIEASGVADPRPIADIAELHKGLERGGTFVLVDAEQILALVDDVKLTDTIERQIVSADLILLSKCDLASEEKQSEARSRIESIAPKVTVLSCANGRFPNDLFMSDVRRDLLPQDAVSHDDHEQIFQSVTLRFPDPVSKTWLRERLESLPTSVWRVKGFVRCDDPPGSALLVQRVGRRTNLTPVDPGDAGSGLDSLVFIGTGDLPLEDDAASHFSVVS